jgi:hypothetical protein
MFCEPENQIAMMIQTLLQTGLLCLQNWGTEYIQTPISITMLLGCTLSSAGGHMIHEYEYLREVS